MTRGIGLGAGALLACAVACGGSTTGVSSTRRDAGPDAAASGGSAGSAAGAGGSSAWAGAAGAPGGAGGGSSGRCRSDKDCSAPTPRCDVASGQCFQCVSTGDKCPTGQVCFTNLRECKPGCNTSSDCHINGGSPVLWCDPGSQTCQGCTRDADCPGGTHCVAAICAP